MAPFDAGLDGAVGARLQEARTSVVALRAALLAAPGEGVSWEAPVSSAQQAGEAWERDSAALADDASAWGRSSAGDPAPAASLEERSLWLRLVREDDLARREGDAEAALAQQRAAAVWELRQHETAVAAGAAAARAAAEAAAADAELAAAAARAQLAASAAAARGELLRAYRHAEARLRAALARQRAVVRERYGDLLPDAPASALSGGDGVLQRALRVAWEGLPQPLAVHVVCLRGLRDRVPPGRYVLQWRLWDRLGGAALAWSAAPAAGGVEVGGPSGACDDGWGVDGDGDDQGGGGRGAALPGTTPLPVRHPGGPCDVELPVQQAAHVALPPRGALRPGMVLVGRLVRVATRSAPVDEGVGWTAVPACGADGAAVTGRLRLPLLRGEPDPTVATFAQFEAAAGDVAGGRWLCNAYVHLSRLPREVVVRAPSSAGGGGWGVRSGGHAVAVHECNAQLTVSGAQLGLLPGSPSRLQWPRDPPAGAGRTLAARQRPPRGRHQLEWRRIDDLSDSGSDDDGGCDAGGGCSPAHAPHDGDAAQAVRVGGARDVDAPAVLDAAGGYARHPPSLPSSARARHWRSRGDDARRLYAAEAVLLGEGAGAGVPLEVLLPPPPRGVEETPEGAAGGSPTAASGPPPPPPPTVLPPEQRALFSYSLPRRSRGGTAPAGGRWLPDTAAAALSAARQQARVVCAVAVGDLCPRRPTAVRTVAAAVASPRWWAQAVALAAALYARAAAHVGAQHALLGALRVVSSPPAGAAPWWGWTDPTTGGLPPLALPPNAVPAHIEVAVVGAGPAGAVGAFLVGVAALASAEAALGGGALSGALAPMGSFVCWLGLAAALDGPLAALGDAAAGRMGCAAPAPGAPPAACSPGDAWRLPRRLAADEGAPALGIAVTAALYALAAGVAAPVWWGYMAWLHQGGAAGDTHRRLTAGGGVSGWAAVRGGERAGWAPLADEEVSPAELRAAVAAAAACGGKATLEPAAEMGREGSGDGVLLHVGGCAFGGGPRARRFLVDARTGRARELFR